MRYDKKVGPKLSIKLTSNPTWKFKTETGSTHQISLNKSYPDALKVMAHETLKMLYHHYGCKKAKTIIEEIEKDLKEHYQDLNP